MLLFPVAAITETKKPFQALYFNSIGNTNTSSPKMNKPTSPLQVDWERVEKKGGKKITANETTEEKKKKVKVETAEKEDREVEEGG